MLRSPLTFLALALSISFAACGGGYADTGGGAGEGTTTSDGGRPSDSVRPGIPAVKSPHTFFESSLPLINLADIATSLFALRICSETRSSASDNTHRR